MESALVGRTVAKETGAYLIRAAVARRKTRSDRDIMTRCVAAARAPGETALCEIMTRKVVYSRPEETVMEASRQMARHRVRRLPVCRGDTVVGVLSLGDLARREDTSFEAAMAICEISLPNDASSG